MKELDDALRGLDFYDAIKARKAYWQKRADYDRESIRKDESQAEIEAAARRSKAAEAAVYARGQGTPPKPGAVVGNFQGSENVELHPSDALRDAELEVHWRGANRYKWPLGAKGDADFEAAAAKAPWRK